MNLRELLGNKKILAGVIVFALALTVGLTFFFGYLMNRSVAPVLEPVFVPAPPTRYVVIEKKEPPKPAPKPVTDDVDENKAVNPLTGELIDIPASEKRPYAVMINNLPLALPQSGLSNADLFYEVLAEGGITRILAVFQEYNAEKIGPIRSARHYYLDFAFDNDAIYVHHGGSPQGYSAIGNLNVDNLDGMRLDGTAFWRDPERVKIPKMYEHSSYSSSQNLYDTAVKYGYRVDRLEDFPYMFGFYVSKTPVGEPHEDTFDIRFSPSQISTFTYNKETRLYERSQNGEPHIDAENGEQVAVSNVIIQYANVYVISGDTEGRRNVELVSSGKGVLYTNGTKEEITWSKESHEKPTVWTDSKGRAMKLNKGKTWICVISEPK